MQPLKKNNRYTMTPCKNSPDGTWVILL